jgi:hypothetical protein
MKEPHGRGRLGGFMAFQKGQPGLQFLKRMPRIDVGNLNRFGLRAAELFLNIL